MAEEKNPLYLGKCCNDWNGHEDLNMKDHFRIYKGYRNKMEVVKDYHENGENYQLIRGAVRRMLCGCA